MPEIDRILAALAGTPRQPAALATLVAVQGSSYRRPGARLLLLGDDVRVGSISGGCLEDDLILRARRVLETGSAEVVTYDTTQENDIVWGVGLGCQGIVRILIEPIFSNHPGWLAVLSANRVAGLRTEISVVHGGSATAMHGTWLTADLAANFPAGDVFNEVIPPRPALLVLGAGDDAQPLVRLARETGWRVTVADSRAAFATLARFPEADEIIVAPPDELASRTVLDSDSHAVVMTHRYTEDLRLLRILLARKLAYLGVLGPRKRTARLLDELAAEGFSPDPEMMECLHAPIGLDLGSITPETIALSIVAELQCARTGRTPIHLRDRLSPIHG